MANDSREQIKAYLDGIFAQTPATQKASDMKEAILADVLEKYDDLIDEGRSPQDAYHRAIGSIGDLEKLIWELKQEQPAPAPSHSKRKGEEEDDAPPKYRCVYRTLKNILWVLVLVSYFTLSFGTHAWHITWLIFLIGIALENVIRAIFDLIGGAKA